MPKLLINNRYVTYLHFMPVRTRALYIVGFFLSVVTIYVLCIYRPMQQSIVWAEQSCSALEHEYRQYEKKLQTMDAAGITKSAMVQPLHTKEWHEQLLIEVERSGLEVQSCIMPKKQSSSIARMCSRGSFYQVLELFSNRWPQTCPAPQNIELMRTSERLLRVLFEWSASV